MVGMSFERVSAVKLREGGETGGGELDLKGGGGETNASGLVVASSAE